MRTLEFEIGKRYKDLRPSEKKVADYLLSYKDDPKILTMTSLSEESKVSQPTVMRFAKALGFSSFKELKLMMIQESMKETLKSQEPQPLYGFNLVEEDVLSHIPSRVIATTVKMMQDTLKSLSTQSYMKTIEAIIKADRVFVFGVENSKSTVNDLMIKLLYLGIHCIGYEDDYLQSICASGLTPGDVAIGISYSGFSKNTVDVMKMAKQSGATTIAITNFEKARIHQYADIVLTASEKQYLYGEAVFSRTTQLVIVDMIYSGILVSDYKKYTKQMDLSSQVICQRAYQE